MTSTDENMIAVYGPTGYTGRQVVRELRQRGMTPILVGRDAERLRAVATDDEEVRVATLDDAKGLRRAFAAAAAVINCVGPFAESAEPVAGAAIAAGSHYLDFTAEQAPLLQLFDRYDELARDAAVAVVPAVGFYGGLGDLLASVAATGIERPTDVTIAYAVDGWRLTAASRATAATMAGRRWVWRDGRLKQILGDPRYGPFDFPAPRGRQVVMEDYPSPEAVTIPRHLDVPSVRSVMTASTIREVFAADAPAPHDVSDEQRADSRFTVVAAVSDGSTERAQLATGRDIYGITAPMIVAAAARLVGSGRTGTLALSEAVDPAAFLAELAAHGIVLEPPVTR